MSFSNAYSWKVIIRFGVRSRFFGCHKFNQYSRFGSRKTSQQFCDWSLSRRRDSFPCSHHMPPHLWTHRRTSASRLSHVMNRARCVEQAIREMATENTGPTGTFSKINSPRDSYRSILNPIFPIHATQLIYQYRSQLPTLFYSIWPK